ncbi:MAG: hypothetical protein KDJ65_11785 [Anaerolineae bacterium]|nr:hypothetical protein [Anaerolineae bacterium]
MGVNKYANNAIVAKDINFKQDGYKTYPPYVLIFGNKNSEGLKLKRRLESNGCQVSRTESISDGLNIAGQQSFDLIVFNFQYQDNEDSLEEAYEKLTTDPKLTNTPVVILTHHDDQSVPRVNESKSLTSVYYLSTDNSSETNLLQIAKQAQYMSYRYM